MRNDKFLSLCSVFFMLTFFVVNNAASQTKTEENVTTTFKKKQNSTPVVEPSNVNSKIQLVDIAKKHYTVDDINQMPDAKRECVNFLYSNSFKLNCSTCTSTELAQYQEKFDVSLYEMKRLPTESVKITLDEKKGLFVDLISRTDLEKQFSQIKAKYNN